MIPAASRLCAVAAFVALSAACGREPATGTPRAEATPVRAPAGPAACPDAGAGPEPDAARLRAFVRGHSRQLRDCYQRALKRDASAGGKATLRFTIEPCGRLTEVGVAARRGKVDDAAACAVRTMVGWTTPFRPASPVTVEYPVAFSASM